MSVEIRTVHFHGDPLLVLRDDALGDLVPLRPLVIGMGLDWSAQYRRVRRDLVLGPAVVVMATTASPAGEKNGICLPIDLVPGFLFGVDSSRVSEAVRPKVLEYQRECFRVLADACFGREPSVGDATQPTEKIPTEIALRMVSEARTTFDKSAAREIWFATGLIRTPSMVAAMDPAQGSLFTYTATHAGHAQ